jgi:hypothetical protein
MTDWQTPAALVVVLITIVIFVVKIHSGKRSCGSNCSCPTKGMSMPRPTNADEDSKCPPK